MKNIYQHYPDSLHAFIKQIIHICRNVKLKSYQHNVGFIESIEQKIVEQVTTHFSNLKVKYIALSGTCERKYVIISVSNKLEKKVVLNIYNVEYNSKFRQIEHRHILGCILNSPIDYKLIGDIIISEQQIQIICCEQALGQLELYANTLNAQKVTYKKSNIVNEKIQMKQSAIFFISSNRLDSFVKNIIHKNREDAKKLIKNKQVKVNQIVVSNFATKIREQDIISIHRNKRIQVISMSENKNNKIKVIINF